MSSSYTIDQDIKVSIVFEWIKYILLENKEKEFINQYRSINEEIFSSIKDYIENENSVYKYVNNESCVYDDKMLDNIFIDTCKCILSNINIVEKDIRKAINNKRFVKQLIHTIVLLILQDLSEDKIQSYIEDKLFNVD